MYVTLTSMISHNVHDIATKIFSTIYQVVITTCYDVYYFLFSFITELDPCSNHQCQNGAICVPDADSCADYSCLCPDCYSGRFCQIGKITFYVTSKITECFIQ